VNVQFILETHPDIQDSISRIHNALFKEQTERVVTLFNDKVKQSHSSHIYMYMSCIPSVDIFKSNLSTVGLKLGNPS